MKIASIKTVYPEYINLFYSKNMKIKNKDYRYQLDAILDDCAFESNFLLLELNKLGYETDLFFYNIEPLQKAWNDEYRNSSLFDILIYQLKTSNPDILLLNGINIFSEKQIQLLRQELPNLKKIVSWYFGVMNSEVVKKAKYFDQIYTGSNYYVSLLNCYHNNVRLLYHSFFPDILKKIDNRNLSKSIVFPGSIAYGVQTKRFELLGKLIESNLPVDFYGKIYGTLVPDSIINTLRTLNTCRLLELKNIKKLSHYEKLIRNNMHESVFGLQYYNIIANSSLCINVHGGCTTLGTGNARMTEVTGVGTCLVTDYREGNKEMFEPDYEIVEYKSTDELIEKCKCLIEHPEKAKEIALAGQRKTLSKYTYKQKAAQLDCYLKELMRGY